jgi:hypothetical protein
MVVNGAYLRISYFCISKERSKLRTKAMLVVDGRYFVLLARKELKLEGEATK